MIKLVSPDLLQLSQLFPETKTNLISPSHGVSGINKLYFTWYSQILLVRGELAKHPRVQLSKLEFCQSLTVGIVLPGRPI